MGTGLMQSKSVLKGYARTAGKIAVIPNSEKSDIFKAITEKRGKDSAFPCLLGCERFQARKGGEPIRISNHDIRQVQRIK